MDMKEEIINLRKQIAVLNIRVSKINELYKQLKIIISLNEIPAKKNKAKRDITYNGHLAIEERMRNANFGEYEL